MVFSAQIKTAPGDDNDALSENWQKALFFPFEAVFTDPQLLWLPYLEGGSPWWKTKLEGISLVLLKWLDRRRAERLPGGADVCVCAEPRVPAKSSPVQNSSAQPACLFDEAEGGRGLSRGGVALP